MTSAYAPTSDRPVGDQPRDVVSVTTADQMRAGAGHRYRHNTVPGGTPTAAWSGAQRGSDAHPQQAGQQGHRLRPIWSMRTSAVVLGNPGLRHHGNPRLRHTDSKRQPERIRLRANP
jgi:hypothetical protein